LKFFLNHAIEAAASSNEPQPKLINHLLRLRDFAIIVEVDRAMKQDNSG
jgi:hypothetical protein